MKRHFRATACCLMLLSCGIRVHGQGTFQNLNFELANNLPSGSSPTSVPVANAFPDWTVYVAGTNQLTQVFYNGISGGSALVTLIGRNASTWSNQVIAGNYTATLDAGEYTGDIDTSAAIAQTGLVPASAQSLRFYGSLDPFGGLTVTFNGQNLPFYPLSAGANYEIYGADISPFADQTGELRFTQNPNASNPFAIAFLDNISFSVNPIPEPGTCGLILCGAVAFGVSRWRKRYASSTLRRGDAMEGR